MDEFYESFEVSFKEMSSFLPQSHGLSHSDDPPLSSSDYDQLKMETVLMIITAASRNINLNLWFNLTKNNGCMSIPEFSNKLSSLVSAISIGEDEKIKKELELAISSDALDIIYDLCLEEAEQVEEGEEIAKTKHFPLVNVEKFLNYCFLKINHYFYESNQSKKSMKVKKDENSDENEESEDNMDENLKIFKNNIQTFNHNFSSSSVTASPTSSAEESQVSNNSSTNLELVSNNLSRNNNETDSDNYDDFFLNAQKSESIKPIYSNFGEEEDLHFLKEKLIIETDLPRIDDPPKKVNQLNSSISSSLTCSNFNLKSNLNIINSNNKVELKKKLKKILKSADFYHFIQLYLGFLSPSLHPSYIPNRGKIIFNKEKNNLIQSKNTSETSYSTLALPLPPAALLSSSLTSLHKNPQTIRTKNYRWIKLSELKEAFLYGNFSMNDYHLKLFSELMVDFSLIYDDLYVKKVKKIINLNEKESNDFFFEESAETELNDEIVEEVEDEQEGEIKSEMSKPRNYPPVFNGDNVHSEWLKKFLTHLRHAKEETTVITNVSSSIDSIPHPPATSIIQPDSKPVSTEIIPLLWQEWICERLKKEVKINNNKNNFFNLFLYGKKKDFFYNFTSIDSFHNLITFILNKYNSNFKVNQNYFKKHSLSELDEKIRNNKENLEKITKNLSHSESQSVDLFEVLSLLKFNLLFYKDIDYFDLLIQYNLEAWSLDIDCSRNFQYHYLKEKEKLKKDENFIKKYIQSEEFKNLVINNIMKKKLLELNKSFTSSILKPILTNYFNYLIENNTKKSSNVMNWFQFLQNEANKLKKKVESSKELSSAPIASISTSTSFSSFSILKKQVEELLRSIKVCAEHKVMVEKSLNKLKLNGKKVTVSAKILDNYQDLVKKKKKNINSDNDDDEYEFENEDVSNGDNEKIQDKISNEEKNEINILPIIIITKKNFFEEFNFLFNFYKINIRSFDKFFESNIEILMVRICENFKNEEIESKKRFNEWIKSKNKEKKSEKKIEVETNERKEKELLLKKKKGEKAYDKWVKLRKKNLYKSNVDKKVHDVPSTRHIKHSERWIKDENIHYNF